MLIESYNISCAFMVKIFIQRRVMHRYVALREMMRVFSCDRIANLTQPIEHFVESNLLIGVDVNDSRYLPSVLIDSANRTSGIRLDGAICQRQMRRLHAPIQCIYTCERYLIRTRSAPPLHRRFVAANEEAGKLGVRRN